MFNAIIFLPLNTLTLIIIKLHFPDEKSWKAIQNHRPQK